MNRGISARRASLHPLCFTSVTALNSEEENDPPTYKEAFPPLPEKAPCLEAAQEPAGPWSKIRPIKASVITQVGGSRCPIPPRPSLPAKNRGSEARFPQSVNSFVCQIGRLFAVRSPRLRGGLQLRPKTTLRGEGCVGKLFRESSRSLLHK